MASTTTYVVQQFERKRGRLVPGTRDAAPSSNGALKRAKAVTARVPGAAALKVEADDETGELHAVDVLGEFGEVPEDFRDTLMGG